ncbi:MAG: hypothetical protein GY765_07055 [bacterium]|nr:hypothetical protein [bacterium]
MNDPKDAEILKRILAHFEKIAPGMVEHSVASLSTAHPIIDVYDIDFYMEKMENALDDVDKEKLKEIAFEDIDRINDIFFKYFKTARVKQK